MSLELVQSHYSFFFTVLNYYYFFFIRFFEFRDYFTVTPKIYHLIVDKSKIIKSNQINIHSNIHWERFSVVKRVYPDNCFEGRELMIFLQSVCGSVGRSLWQTLLLLELICIVYRANWRCVFAVLQICGCAQRRMFCTLPSRQRRALEWYSWAVDVENDLLW